MILSASLLACIAVLAAPGANLLENGGFDRPIEAGWTEDVRGSAGNATFELVPAHDDTAGKAVRVAKFLTYQATLSQEAVVTCTNLDFSFSGEFSTERTSATCWPVAGVALNYLDGEGKGLGRTLFILRDQFCTWCESDSVHFIDVEQGEWNDFTLNISAELADNLPAVDPDEVASVRLDLFAYVNGT